MYCCHKKLYIEEFCIVLKKNVLSTVIENVESKLAYKDLYKDTRVSHTFDLEDKLKDPEPLKEHLCNLISFDQIEEIDGHIWTLDEYFKSKN